jgi:hypothetical protein
MTAKNKLIRGSLAIRVLNMEQLNRCCIESVLIEEFYYEDHSDRGCHLL